MALPSSMKCPRVASPSAPRGVSSETEKTLNKVFTHFENLWLGRTEAISGQIEQRTRAVSEALETRIEHLAATITNNANTATQALGNASGEAERTLAQVANAAERTLTSVSGETERAVGLVIGRFENMWTGRIDAINEHIDSRTKAVAEALGWAGINEVPVVVSLYQRAGPSTGLPTRHEQGDLQFAINAGHGEFPRLVFASGDIEESFYDSIKVFNFAEKYQMPVIHMLDKAIANSVTTCNVFDPARVRIERGALATAAIIEKDKGVAGNYLRFKLTENPITPRVPLGTQDAIFWNTGDEHTEEGHITEDPEIRVRMVDKRMEKLDLALKEIPDDDKAVMSGDPKADVAIISWGSTKGAILDAMEILDAEGKKVRYVQMRLLHPFPTELVRSMLEGARVVVDIEMNYIGQLGALLSQHVGRAPDYKVVKYNGRPMSLDEVYNAVQRIISGDAPRRQVLKGGT